jgi:hypothetical protein
MFDHDDPFYPVPDGRTRCYRCTTERNSRPGRWAAVATAGAECQALARRRPGSRRRRRLVKRRSFRDFTVTTGTRR